MVVIDLQKYRYRIDADDRICEVDSWWLAFARENGAPELTAESVLNQSLWDFIVGRETQDLYREIHARVRSTGKWIMLPFRCDSPFLQRQMRMTISPDGEGRLLYETVMDRVVPHDHRLDVLDPSRLRNQSFLTMCSCCKRALLEPCGWLDVEEFTVKLQLFEQPQVPELRYGICPDCAVTGRTPPHQGSAA